MGAGDSFDGWSAAADLGLPPIRVGFTAVPGGDHLLLFNDPGRTVAAVVDDLARHRGYVDGKAQGGGLSLFMGGLPLALTLRSLDGAPVPALAPLQTHGHLTAYGNLTLVEVASMPPTGRPMPDEFAAQLVELMAPRFAAIKDRTAFPVVHQWAQFTSGLLDLLLTTGMRPDAEAVAFVDRLTEAHPLLRRSRPRLGWAEWTGAPRPYAVRRVCCFNYRGKSGDYCGSLCPLVDRDERDRAAQLAWAG